jgi:ABC-2 type transport system ATP-binding protein
MSDILQISNLSKNYGGHSALRNVNLNVPTGKTVGLLGPNGSGKTTLIKVIMGLLSADGQVSINGEPPGAQANSFISYLPDLSHIPMWFTSQKAIKFFADFFEDCDSTRAQKMLEEMKIPANKQLRRLSRGMQEKVQLSLVMCRRAKLYVLDEPIGAVDPASREIIIETILQNLPENSSILLSTHIIADIEGILDTVVFIANGEIILQGEADALREERGKSIDRISREVFRGVY